MAELTEGIAAPGVDLAALLNRDREGAVGRELADLDVHEVDAVHVKLLRLFENAKVTLAPHKELPIVGILYQGS